MKIYNSKISLLKEKYSIIYIITLLAFVTYSAFPTLKYVFTPFFVLTSAILLLSSSKTFLSNLKIMFNYPIVWLIYLSFIIAMFVDIGEPRYLINEFFRALIAFLLILMFPSGIVDFFKDRDNVPRYFVDFYLIVTLVFGVCHFLLYFAIFFDILDVHSLIFGEISQFTISFDSDGNYYSLIFLIALFLLITVPNYFISKKAASFLLILYSFNVLLTFSRRAFVIYFIFILLFSAYYYFTENNIIKGLIKQFFVIFLFLVFFLVIGFHFRDSLIQKPKSRIAITYAVFRMGLPIEPNLNYLHLWKELWEIETVRDSTNLLKNGDFSDGRRYWWMSINPTDSARIELIKTPFGNGVRIERYRGTGNFPLNYQGPGIFYYKDVEYTFKYKFKVISGTGIPFGIGWYIKDNGNYLLGLKQSVSELKDGWYQGICKYKFKETHKKKVYTFMHSLKPGATVEFADIHLLSSDSLNRPVYIKMKKTHIEKNSTFKFALPRIDRWRYAIKLFKQYTIIEKIFGKGFSYMSEYAEEFNVDNDIDYPHNVFISSLLFSGLIGGFIYIFFIVLSLLYYYRNRNYLKILLYIYFVVIFFMLFSANSHFSVPIFIILSLIPFYFDGLMKNGFLLKKIVE